MSPEFTPQQLAAADKLHEAHERFVKADEALGTASPEDEPSATAAYLVARNLHQEAIREAEAAFQPLMP